MGKKKKNTMAALESSCAAATQTDQNEHYLSSSRRPTQKYITIHDYVSALHPWLMELRQDIARADNLMGERTPEESESLLMDITNLDYSRIMDEKRFLRSRYIGPPIPLPGMSQECQDWLSKCIFRKDVPFSVKKPPPPPPPP
ncbi:hypothetical protein CSAL01_13154 [Colletotrichum salicis]|uniref:Uncharacterized protein n=1 Tax=Colletotrichum salicis TaxID=1209931 RepID=A0A135TDD3_9PEZI|nr:hypothetical protein CSAL01_13154 [Colletotrichum salicis]